MQVTLNWLKDFVAIEMPTEELCHRLTMSGLEVDAVEPLGTGLDGVVVASLEAVEPHPDADRLTVCRVNDGQETLQVVCGATNHRAGDYVALARVGTVLPGDFKIKKSKIRGQESQGMLCSERELGLAEESQGIMILPAGLVLGSPVAQALKLTDTRIELGLTPNRPDCLSMLGVAREIAAFSGGRASLPAFQLKEDGPPIESLTSVTIEDAERCPRYAARLIQGVTIGPAPEWLTRRLESVGVRSINNVVDVTNYVMLELGHPLHAFDFDLLARQRIVVRSAGEGEVFTTLDGQARPLAGSDLMICDGDGPVALAGIMGGENSEIRPQTCNVLLESAYFQPSGIRRTSRRLGLHTESSHRFERGADVDMVPVALDRAAALIRQLAGGTVASGRLDVYPSPLEPLRLRLGLARTNALLGLDLTASRVRALLESIGLKVTEMAAGEMEVVVPRFRPDLERDVDLIEEVARLNGYDAIPATMPSGAVVMHAPPPQARQISRMKTLLAAQGFCEVINYSFISPRLYDRLLLAPGDPRRQGIALLNPLTDEQSVMRTTLIPSLLETVARNLAYRSQNLRLFELRPTFLPQPGEELPAELYRLTAVLNGRRAPVGWAAGDERVDFFDAKGIVETLLETFRLPPVKWHSDDCEPYLHPGKACRILCGSRELGTVGEIHPAVLEAFGIDEPVFLIDLAVSELLAEASSPEKVTAPSRYPDTFRDSAFLLAESVPAEQVFAVLNSLKLRDVEETVIFDIYRGQSLPPGTKSLGLRVRYRSAEKTLTDDEINRTHAKLVSALCRELPAEIR